MPPGSHNINFIQLYNMVDTLATKIKLSMQLITKFQISNPRIHVVCQYNM